MSREEEIYVLLKRIFPYNYAGNIYDDNFLFKECRELGSSYCIKFNENGYDEKYSSFDFDQVTKEVAKLITDLQLRELFRSHREKLSSDYNFFGPRYTYKFSTKEFSDHSEWDSIRKKCAGPLNNWTTLAYSNRKVYIGGF